MRNVKLGPVRAALLPCALLASGLFCAAGPAYAQGFDCRYAATPDEKMICRDPRLGRLDEELGSAYARQYYDVPGSERGRLDRQEDAWVVSRRRCGADAVCIEQRYRRRIEELGGPARSDPGQTAAAPPDYAARRLEDRTISRREEEVTRRRETAPAYDGAFARPEPGATVPTEQRDVARPEPGIRSEGDVEVIEEDAAKPRHHHRTAARASRAGKPPTRAEATRALRAAKEEPRREQHVSDHVEPPKNAAAAENPPPAANANEGAVKKEAGRRRGGHGAASHSTEKASRTAASASSAPMPPQSGGDSAHGSAEAGKDSGPPAGSAPSISWVNPPPAGGK